MEKLSFLYETKVLEQSHVSPSPDFVSQPSLLPLTFLDVLWLCLPSRPQRVFFYEFPVTTTEFMHSILPKLKHSLSLALQHFYPFAGKLVCPAQPSKPHISYENGDSVPLTVVEATGDLDHLTADHCVRDVREFHLLVPDFPPSSFSDDGNIEYLPVLALQVTIFPSSGICIGITFLHVVADGKSSADFMKLWASIFRSNGDSACVGNSLLPSYGRDGITDPYGLEEIYLNQWWKSHSNSKQKVTFSIESFENKMRRTFLISRVAIEKLKELASRQYSSNNELITTFHVTGFVAVCAFTWVCLLKSRASELSDSVPSDDDETVYLGFVADCRNRYGFDIPENYFGNCLATVLITARAADITRENGLYMAAQLISSGVKELKNDVLKVIHRSMTGFLILGNSHFFSVAGSPKLSVYETDFGWGKPINVEVVHIDSSKAIALAESRDEKGGMELGLALSRDEMTTFTSMFEEGIKSLF